MYGRRLHSTSWSTRMRDALYLGKGDALLLDFDGTLVEIADVPDRIVMPESLGALLLALRDALDGTLCIITGRALSDLRRYVPPGIDVMAEHGAVTALSCRPVALAPGWPMVWGSTLDAIEEKFPGVLVERKHAAIALHYRLNPGAEADLIELATQLCKRGPTGFCLVKSFSTIEIIRRGTDKGEAVTRLMSEVPYCGKRPVFLGDSPFDYPAFKAVRRMGGMGVDIHEAFDGEPERVRSWLSQQVEEVQYE